MRYAVADIDDIAVGAEARGRHRFQYGHVEVDDVENSLQHAHGDPGAAGRADDDAEIVVVEDHGRRHSGEATFPRRDGSGVPRARVEDAHAAVVHEAQAFADDARRHAERMGESDGVATLVYDTDVRRVAGFRHAFQTHHMRLLAAGDDLRELRRVLLVDEHVGGHIVEIGIADPSVLVDGGVLHGLADDADVVG